MKINKVIATTLMVLLSCNTNIFALENQDINRKFLDSIEDRHLYNPNLYAFLNKNGIKQYDYQTYLEELSYFNKSKEKEWYELETGTIFQDAILFSHPTINKILDDVKKSYNLTNDEKAKDIVKKSIMCNSTDYKKVLQECLDKYCNLDEVFSSVFKRNPSQQEKVWLKNLNTLKYAAYSGKLNGLSQNQINIINAKNGYSLFNIFNEEAIYYRNFTKKSSSLEELEIQYIKAYSEFSSVRSIIFKNYNIDIFNSTKGLSDKERLEIHNKSTVDFVFNDDLAIYHVVSLLIDKGYIKEQKPEKPGISTDVEKPNSSEKNTVDDFVQKEHPAVEINKFFKEIQTIRPDLYAILNSLNISYSKFFNSMNAYLAKEKQLCFKYKGREFETGLIDKKGIIPSEVSRVLLELIASKLDGKTVHSIEKTMLLFDDKVNIFSAGINDREIKLIDLKKELNLVGIELYYKNITK